MHVEHMSQTGGHESEGEDDLPSHQPDDDSGDGKRRRAETIRRYTDLIENIGDGLRCFRPNAIRAVLAGAYLWAQITVLPRSIQVRRI